MKKRFKLVDLDCANCAAKMEDAIKKVEEIVKVCKRVEPDCEIVP